MSLIFGIDNIGNNHCPAAVSIGNFDGVHLGHQQVVSTLLSEAKGRGVKATVLTFEPLAREYFSATKVMRLSTLQEKADSLMSLGVEQVICVEFDKKLAAMTASEFIQQILIDKLDTRFLSVGDDFKFGNQRAGDFSTLVDAGDHFGFSVQKHDTFELLGERVSSGRIRTAIANGELNLARQLLGRSYSISGQVVMGQQVGRTLKFPTANIPLGERCVPVSGVYAVVAHVLGKLVKGVANIGYRPTVDGSEQRLEVHLFDFDTDIYGENIVVDFVEKIRDEKKFASLDELKNQISLDAVSARTILARNR